MPVEFTVIVGSRIDTLKDEKWGRFNLNFYTESEKPMEMPSWSLKRFSKKEKKIQQEKKRYSRTLKDGTRMKNDFTFFLDNFLPSEAIEIWQVNLFQICHIVFRELKVYVDTRSHLKY